ncbi:extracellular solute-binding protein [Labrys monachus]|nr:extracellular solute-binding protein [Labrys monachus]
MNEIFQKDCFDILKLKLDRGEIDRRSFLRGIALMGAGALALQSGAVSAQEKEMVMVTWGGDGTKAFEKAFAAPFAKATGIRVKSDGSGPTEGAVKAQFEGGKISWDVMDTEFFSSKTLGEKGYLGKIDYNIVKKEKIHGSDWHDWGVANYYNTYVMVYNKKKFGDNPPKTWADFFDAEKFPGKRTLPKYMIGAPEAALLADGVSPDKLYPMDLDRAFKKIKDFMPNIVSFWGSAAESQQAVIDGEAVIGLLWGTRAQLVHRDTGGDVTFTFQDALLTPSSWSYMNKNPAGAEIANQFIAAAQDPALQIELLRLVGCSPANPAAAAMVPEDLKPFDCMQPEHLKIMHSVDMEWYGKNYGAALDRFIAMIAN